MRASFVNAEAPLRIGVIRRRTPEEAIADALHCVSLGANAVDLHLSCLEERYHCVEALRAIAERTSVPMMALHYSQRYDGSGMDCTEEERTALLRLAIEAGASAVDVQGYTFDRAAMHAYHGDCTLPFYREGICEVVTDAAVIERQCELIEQAHAAGAEVILSTHTKIPMPCEAVVELALFLEKRKPNMIKIVSQCTNDDELAEALRTALVLKREVKTKVHFHAAGAAGKLTRILNPLLGGYMIFCNGELHEGSNREQLDLHSAVAVVENMKKLME